MFVKASVLFPWIFLYDDPILCRGDYRQIKHGKRGLGYLYTYLKNNSHKTPAIGHRGMIFPK